MNRVFLIARQEFVKFVTRRGFLFTLIGVPVWMALATIVPTMLGNHGGHTVFAVVDRSGGAYRDAIAQSLARRDARLGSHDLVMVDVPPDGPGAGEGGGGAHRKLRSRKLFATTLKLERLMAALTIIGESCQWVRG